MTMTIYDSGRLNTKSRLEEEEDDLLMVQPMTCTVKRQEKAAKVLMSFTDKVICF